jgi:hypothetical protein
MNVTGDRAVSDIVAELEKAWNAGDGSGVASGIILGLFAVVASKLVKKH